VVDAYDLPTAEADLAVYRSYFGLPACTTANGCFRKVDQNGGINYPVANAGWGQEIALDIDMVSAVCPSCHILLVEASDNTSANLGAAVNKAVSLGAIAVSNSYGGPESIFEATSLDPYYNHPGVAITAATGDCGYNCAGSPGNTHNSVAYPASSPYVIAVGGTSLTRDASARGWTESAWGNADGGAGSGCSAYEPKPSWQLDTGCTNRTEADVSAVADPETGVYGYENGSWYEFGGTSAASPIIAATFALAGSPAAGTYPASYLYADTADLNDVTSGNNDVTWGGTGYACTVTYLCNGVAGYDGPTGLGTPNGTGAFTVPAVPGKPTGLTAAAGDASAVLSWTAPATDGGRSIIGYRVTETEQGLGACVTNRQPEPRQSARIWYAHQDLPAIRPGQPLVDAAVAA
jgi:subtilase family serine protease